MLSGVRHRETVSGTAKLSQSLCELEFYTMTPMN